VDPTGLLDTILAVAVYPGAAFLALATLLHARLAGRSAGLGARGAVPAVSLLPVLAAIVASAMLPMVGSPVLRLPPLTGVAGNVVAVAVLLAVAVDLGGASRRTSLLAAAAALPVLGLAAAAGTVSVVGISTVRSPGSVIARLADRFHAELSTGILSSSCRASRVVPRSYRSVANSATGTASQRAGGVST